MSCTKSFNLEAISFRLAKLHFFKKNCHFRPLFPYFRLFNKLTVNKWSIKILLMTGFELRTSGIGSDCSTN